MNQYDVIVIGAGPGGYVAALRASELGKKTAIIERENLGGVCLNVGCIPSKSLLKNAEIARMLRKNAKTFGISFENLQLDYAAAVERSRKTSKRLCMGVASLLKTHSVDVFEGNATINQDKKITIQNKTGGLTELMTKSIILATGAHSIELPGMESDGEKILNYQQAILQTRLPKSVVIIGGGAIGVEFATIWNAYGVEVTVVEMKNHLVPNEDSEVSVELERMFKKQGIKIKTGTALIGVDKTDAGVAVHVRSENGEMKIDAEQVLIAIGFQPNSSGIGLESTGILLHPKGWVLTDDDCQTNIKGIYAIGDLTGKYLLAHSASAMGKIAAEKIAGLEPDNLDANLIPHTTFCFPQIASFGMTEDTASEKGLQVLIKKASFIANGKALGIGENEGWAKIIADASTGIILGASLIGPEVSEMLPILTLAAKNRLTIQDIHKNIFAHPTLSEILMETV